MSHTDRVHILGISGSLRRVSKNTALLEAAALLAPPYVEVAIYRELEDLPPFNPDREAEAPPAAVARFRELLQAADAIVISSPEYAHGVPGVLKNALDWVVGSGELTFKPIALINPSARARHAWTSLAETLTVMAARVIIEASVTISLDGKLVDADGIVRDLGLSRALRAGIDALVTASRQSLKSQAIYERPLNTNR